DRVPRTPGGSSAHLSWQRSNRPPAVGLWAGHLTGNRARRRGPCALVGGPSTVETVLAYRRKDAISSGHLSAHGPGTRPMAIPGVPAGGDSADGGHARKPCD